MKRKAIAMAMAMMMIASAASVCSAASVTDFKDVPSQSWYYTSVKGAVDDGYMNGVSKDAFAPSNNLTRAMFATILARYDKATVDNTAASAFTDVEANKWYTGSVVWGNKNGIINGYSATKFGTNDFIKREDLALMVYRYVNFKKYTLKEKTPVTFKDADQISAYAKEALEYCRVHGLFIGDQNGYLHPQKLITRAEAAAVMERIDLVIKESTGGGGGGSSSSSTKYDYVDYTVTAKLATSKSSRTFIPMSYDNVTANTADGIYHVAINKSTNVYDADKSDDISLIHILNGFVDDNVRLGQAYKEAQNVQYTDIDGNSAYLVKDGEIQDVLVGHDAAGNEIKVDPVETAKKNYPADLKSFVNEYMPTDDAEIKTELAKDDDVKALYRELDPENFVQNGNELKNLSNYQAIAKSIIAHSENLRQTYIVKKNKTADEVVEIMNRAIAKAKERGITYNITEAQKNDLAAILVIKNPTLEDKAVKDFMSKYGTETAIDGGTRTTITISKDVTEETAKNYLNKLVTKSGTDIDTEKVVNNIASKVVGNYEVSVMIDKKADTTNTSKH